jgi:aspartate dehydrogenase
MPVRIGLVGFGFIGEHLYRRLIEGHERGLQLAFVWNRSPGRLARVPLGLILRDLAEFERARPDVIVEVAHPSVTREHAERFLGAADYLCTSVAALADDALARRLEEAAKRARRRLFLPHGALVGLDAFHEQRHRWAEAAITFRKHPASLDFSESGIDPAGIAGPTVLYEGPVRGIAPLFPRNVNTMVTFALATVGLDACRARLVADPGLNRAVAEAVAVGKDGSRVATVNEQPAAGVSGADMLGSMLGSLRAAAGRAPGLAFV